MLIVIECYIYYVALPRHHPPKHRCIITFCEEEASEEDMGTNLGDSTKESQLAKKLTYLGM